MNKKFGCFWKCPHCYKKRSILFGSIFADSKSPMNITLHMIYCWSMEYSCCLTALECHINPNSVTDLFFLIRNACFQNIFAENIQRIGGPGTTIEVDETLFSKRKYNQGSLLHEQWIFGGICRETGDFFAYLVPDRKSETLFKIIEDNILPGTRIISDQFVSYHIIDSQPHPQAYYHETVNHSKNFVDPISGAHTQKIERLWRELKRTKHRYYGVARNHTDLHLAEFLWRYRNIKDKSQSFNKTIELLKETKFQ